MAISDTITSMYENVGNVYDVLELAGADLTNVDKNIENLKQSWEERLLYFLANGTDVVWNNWLPKVTGTGETITLNNTIEAKMNIVYKGNTYQYSTTGKNLFNVNATHENNLSDAGITATFNSDGTITVNGTKNANYKAISYNITLPAGTYYFSGCPSGGSGGGYSIIVQTTNEISSQIFDTGNGATFTLTEQKKISFFPVRVGADAVTFNNTVFKPMIARVPVTYNDYEPYTGNQPSPNPDYPQDIQVVSGDNSIKVEGKNLLNDYDLINRYKIASIEGNLLTSNAISSNYDTFQPMTKSQKISLIENSDYYVSFDCRLKSGTYGGRIGRATIINTSGQALTINDTPILNPKMSSNFQRMCFKSTANTSTSERIAIMLQVQENLNSAIFEIKNIMISTSNETTYISYETPQTYPINIGNIELCKIGDYQDKIYKDNGKWYLNKEIGKVVLNGSEIWDYYTSTSKPVFFIVTENFGIYYKQEANLSCYCDYYKGKGQVASFDDVYNLGNNVIAFRTAYTRLVIRDDRFNNTEDFKAELSTHNTIVYYVLATPTYEEITDTTLISQLEAIKKSYNTQTNISQTNADKPFILDVVALGELI